MESLYDYGARAGFWRLHRLFTRKQIPCTVYAVGMALERNPDVCRAMTLAGWEVASHGYRWVDYQNVDEELERAHIKKTVKIHETMVGTRPVGMYQGKVRRRNVANFQTYHSSRKLEVIMISSLSTAAKY